MKRITFTDLSNAKEPFDIKILRSYNSDLSERDYYDIQFRNGSEFSGLFSTWFEEKLEVGHCYRVKTDLGMDPQKIFRIMKYFGRKE